MKETKQDKSIPKTGKSASGKKRSTKGKTNPMGTAFDLSGTLVTQPIMEKKPRKSKQTPNVAGKTKKNTRQNKEKLETKEVKGIQKPAKQIKSPSKSSKQRDD